jgi:AraC-like DNA-binding protein
MAWSGSVQPVASSKAKIRGMMARVARFMRSLYERRRGAAIEVPAMIPQKSSSSGGGGVHLSVHGLVAAQRVAVRTVAPALVMTLEAAVAQVESGRIEATLDRSVCLVVPMAILAFEEPAARRMTRAHRRLGVDLARLTRWVGSVTVLPRTLWVHEVVHRYVFERYTLGQHQNTATRFLETEILKEIYFLFRDREEGADRQSAARRYGASVERAIGYIESQLFGEIDVAGLAARVGASESTLLRAFRREAGCTPGAYWRQRRLEEALILLRSGRHTVAEVATRVGYDNPTAFGFAFGKRFGKPPSSYLPKNPARRAP